MARFRTALDGEQFKNKAKMENNDAYVSQQISVWRRKLNSPISPWCVGSFPLQRTAASARCTSPPHAHRREHEGKHSRNRKERQETRAEKTKRKTTLQLRRCRPCEQMPVPQQEPSLQRDFWRPCGQRAVPPRKGSAPLHSLHDDR